MSCGRCDSGARALPPRLGLCVLVARVAHLVGQTLARSHDSLRPVPGGFRTTDDVARPVALAATGLVEPAHPHSDVAPAVAVAVLHTAGLSTRRLRLVRRA